jgi:hypothetical protein
MLRGDLGGGGNDRLVGGATDEAGGSPAGFCFRENLSFNGSTFDTVTALPLPLGLPRGLPLPLGTAAVLGITNFKGCTLMGLVDATSSSLSASAELLAGAGCLISLSLIPPELSSRTVS